MSLARSRSSAIALALALVLAVAGTGCTGERGLSAGAAARLLEGTSVLLAAGDGWRALSVGDEVPDGARVRTGLARARLELDRGELWLGESATVAVNDDEVAVERGEVVVRSRGVTTRWDAVTVTGEGAYRLSPGASPRVGVYDGEVDVRRPGEERRVPALRQLGLGTRRLPAQPDPLYYELDDPWDRELLPRAVAFDDEVATLARGIDREYGTAPQPPSFYASFAAIEPETVPVLAATARTRTAEGAFGPPSDALVTLFVADAVATVHEQELAEAVDRVAERRTAGARWGLVALELEVEAQQLAAAVDLARERRETVAPRRPGGGPSPRPTDEPTGRPRPTPTPPPPDDPTPSPTPSEDPRDVIEDTLEDILGPGPGAAGVAGRLLPGISTR